MIFRPTEKLNTKIRAAPRAVLPIYENALADWTGHLFAADLTQYVLLSNTKSLYSAVMYAKGIYNDSTLIQGALIRLRESMDTDGQAFVYDQFIAPASATVCFAKPLDRTVTDSMNRFVRLARIWLTKGDPSLFDIASKLNKIPVFSLHDRTPREALNAMSK